MNLKSRMLCSVFALALLAGCASADLESSNPYMGPAIARPSRILVYDFTSNLNDVYTSSPLRSQLSGASSSSADSSGAISRQLGAQISSDLAARIRGMGLNGVRAMKTTIPRVGDIVIKGYFLTLDQGSATERMALGFGSGSADLRVRVEGYQMTAKGLRLLASGEGSSASGSTPGAAVGLGVALATANPIGLIVGGAVKAEGEASGRETIQGASQRITNLVATRLQAAFQRQGWI